MSSGQDLYNEQMDLIEQLFAAIKKLHKNGREKCVADSDYQIKKAEVELRMLDEGKKITLISDIIRGVQPVADLRLRRDIAEVVYDTNLQYIYALKKKMDIIENQIAHEYGATKYE